MESALPAGLKIPCLDDTAIRRYVRGECTPPEIATIREHLQECADCKARIAAAFVSADGSTQPMRAKGDSQPADAQDAGATAIVRIAHGEGHETGSKELPAASRHTGDPQLTRAAPADPHAPPEPEPEVEMERGQSIGRYLIVDTLGRGGMGVVYAAYDPELDRKVAIKVLRADSSMPQARLLREAQAMARVSHPNVVSVHDVGTLGDRVFVAMEFVEGGTLKDWLKKHKGGWQEVVSVFLDAGKGLSAAHKTGLVHLDFKPENVLMGNDGRIRVTDFGLARLMSHDLPPAPEVPGQGSALSPMNAGNLNVQITLEGVVMGTPAYMAPEQHLGRASDARSDQFSFCASMYWALYKQWPFDPQEMRTAAATASSIGGEATHVERRASRARIRATKEVPAASVIREPPKDNGVPLWLKRAIFRGLALKPAARFENMDALLAKLAYKPIARRRRFAATAAATFLLGSGVAVAYSQATRHNLVCQGADRKLVGIWDPKVQGSVERALKSTGKPYAALVWERTREILNRYADRWIAMHTDACEATRIRGEQSDQVMSLRMICLDRRLGELRALTSVLSEGDAQTLDKAVDATQALPSVQQCANVESLTTQVGLPDDPAARQAIQDVYPLVDQARALLAAGNYKRGLQVSQSAADAAEHTKFQPLEADALLALGVFENRMGNPKASETTLARSLFFADASRSDRVRIQAATELSFATGFYESRFDDSARWADLAKAALARIGGDDELEARAFSVEGVVESLAGKLEQAQGSYERALVLADRGLSKDHPLRTMILSNRGLLDVKRRDYVHAQQVLDEALSLVQQSRGPDHPDAAYAHYNLATLYTEEKKYPEAIEHAMRALKIREVALGKEHPLVADAHDRVATILQEEQRFDEAMAEYRVGMEIKEKVLGKKHPDLFFSYDGIGECLLGLHRYPEAIANLEQALAIGEGDADDLANARFSLAQALWSNRSEHERARGLAKQAADGYLSLKNKEKAARVERWIKERGN